MNFRRKIAVSLLLYTALCGAAFAQVVRFPDPNLRAAVAEKINAILLASPQSHCEVLRRLQCAIGKLKISKGSNTLEI